MLPVRHETPLWALLWSNRDKWLKSELLEPWGEIYLFSLHLDILHVFGTAVASWLTLWVNTLPARMWTRGYGDFILEDSGARWTYYFYIPVTKLPNQNYPGEVGVCFDFLFQRIQSIVMTTGVWGGSHIHLITDRKQSMKKALRVKYSLENQCSAYRRPSIQQMNLWGGISVKV